MRPALVLLPGLNGDPRVYAPQVAAFGGATVVRWLPPSSRPSLDGYARRLADSLDRTAPCVVVGVSFGGIVAQHLCRYVNARRCVLIASSGTAAGLPRPVRLARPLTAPLPALVVDVAVVVGWAVAAAALPGVRRRVGRLTPEQATFERWAVRQLLTWHPPSPACPTVRIHGDRDRVFPAGGAGADSLIRGGGHLLTLRWPDAVNAVVTAVLATVVAAVAGDGDGPTVSRPEPVGVGPSRALP